MPKKPTRDQLAKFLPTQELIRAFEQLFDLTDGDSTNITAIQQSLAALAVRMTETEDAQSEDDINTAAETARTSHIAASLSELAKAVDGLAMVPPVVPSSSAAPVAPGSANSVIVSCDFGASFTDKAQTVVTGLSWVTGTMAFSAAVLAPSGVDPDEMYLLKLLPVIGDIIPGTGFTVTLYSESEARGAYDVMIVGV